MADGVLTDKAINDLQRMIASRPAERTTEMMANGTRILRQIPRVFSKFSSMPLELVFFVTHRCVANCPHCFDWPRRAEIHKHDELTIPEIEKISKSLDTLSLLFLTGGEAFIRDDLFEIADVFYKNNDVYKLQIPSNGWFTEKTVKQMEKLARLCPAMHSSVSVSLDGIGEDHDVVRNKKGLFEHACETIKELQVLAGSYSNIGVNVNLTVSAANQHSAVQTLYYIYKKLKVRNIFLLLTRGEPRDTAAKELDIDAYAKLRNEVEKIGFENKRFGYGGFTFSDIITHKDFLKYKCVEHVARTGRGVVPCVAGSLYGILFANGDVEFCEMKNWNIGNLRENNYNFGKLWFSERASRLKREVRQNGCSCTHECVIACSLLSNPKTLSRMLASKLKRDVKLIFTPGW